MIYNYSMQPEIVSRLVKLNQEFYQSFAQDFSETRQRLQPGVVEIAKTIPLTASLLDLGCGNGLLAEHLIQIKHTGPYLGVDSSPALIEIARQRDLPNAEFIEADLADPGWAARLDGHKYEYILCFALLHHLPGEDLRTAFLNQVHRLLKPDGKFILSVWQFLQSERLRQRIKPWEKIGLDSSQVDRQDYLMDWRRGGHGLRYVHSYTNQELHRLAEANGFTVNGLYTSDGENKKLGLYHIWEKALNS